MATLPSVDEMMGWSLFDDDDGPHMEISLDGQEVLTLHSNIFEYAAIREAYFIALPVSFSGQAPLQGDRSVLADESKSRQASSRRSGAKASQCCHAVVRIAYISCQSIMYTPRAETRGQGTDKHQSESKSADDVIGQISGSLQRDNQYARLGTFFIRCFTLCNDVPLIITSRVLTGLSSLRLALYMAYFQWKHNRKLQDAWPAELLAAVQELRTDLNPKALRLWWKKKFIERTLKDVKLEMVDDKPYLTLKQKPMVATCMVPSLLEALHKVAGHRSATSLAALFGKYFCVAAKGMNHIVDISAKKLQCDICHSEQVLPKAAHSETMRFYRPDQRWQMDHKTIATLPLLKRCKHLIGTAGFKHILTILDCFSKKGWALATKTLTEQEVIERVGQIFDSGSSPDTIQTDNGKAFRSPSLAEFLKKRGIYLKHGAILTPQHQGQDERFNGTIGNKVFRWIRGNWDSAQDWHKHLPRMVDEYNDTKHGTTNVAPDRLYIGRLRTPVSRLADDKMSQYLLNLLDDRSGRFTNLSSTMDKENNFSLAEGVARAIEQREVVESYALSWTGKKNAANRSRQRGGRIKRSAILDLGSLVTIRRPFRGKFPNKTLTPNVNGTVDGVSLGSASYSVKYKDENGKIKTEWVNAVSVFYRGGEADVMNKTAAAPAWKDVRHYMGDFVDGMEMEWRNTRQLISKLDKVEWQDLERETADVLEELDLPDERMISSVRRCELVVFKVLDWLFLQHLREQYICLSDSHDFLDPAKIEMLLAYTHHVHKFKLYMGATSKWYRERFEQPGIVYPALLGAISGKVHKCCECDPETDCQPEHMCCRDWHFARFAKVRWLSQDNKGIYTVTRDGVIDSSVQQADDHDSKYLEIAKLGLSDTLGSSLSTKSKSSSGVMSSGQSKLSDKEEVADENYKKGYWLSDMDILYVLWALLGRLNVCPPSTYEEFMKGMTDLYVKGHRYWEKGDTPADWYVQVINTDARHGVHWLLAVAKLEPDVPKVHIRDPLHNLHVSVHVEEALTELRQTIAPADVASFKIEAMKVQKDGWRCGYHSTWWQLEMELATAQGFDLHGWHPEAPPKFWDEVVWLLLQIRDIQEKLRIGSALDIGVSSMFFAMQDTGQTTMLDFLGVCREKKQALIEVAGEGVALKSMQVAAREARLDRRNAGIKIHPKVFKAIAPCLKQAVVDLTEQLDVEAPGKCVRLTRTLSLPLSFSCMLSQSSSFTHNIFNSPSTTLPLPPPPSPTHPPHFCPPSLHTLRTVICTGPLTYLPPYLQPHERMRTRIEEEAATPKAPSHAVHAEGEWNRAADKKAHSETHIGEIRWWGRRKKTK
jgi:transposase InsO family protein